MCLVITMGNTNTQTEVQNFTEGTSVDPEPHTKTISNGSVSRDKVTKSEHDLPDKLSKGLLTKDEDVHAKELPASLVRSSSLTVENDTNDKNPRKDAVLDCQEESYIDETDGRDENEDVTSLSNQGSTSPTLDNLSDEDKRDNVHDVTDDKNEDKQESKTLLNSENIQDDFENSASDRSHESYNVEEACPIVDDLDLSREESGSVSSEDIEEIGNKEDQQKEIDAEIQMQVARFFDSIEKVETDQQEILDLINKRSMSQKELNEDGVNIIAELESIVEKFTQRRREKDEAIQQLKAILSTLTEKLSVVEQEVQSMPSRQEAVDLTRKCDGSGQSDEATTRAHHMVTPKPVQTTAEVVTDEQNVPQESPEVEIRKEGTVVTVKEQNNKDVERKDTSSHQSSTGLTTKEDTIEDSKTSHLDGTHNAGSNDESNNIPSTASNAQPSSLAQTQELKEERHSNPADLKTNHLNNRNNNKNHADQSNIPETPNVYASKSRKTLPDGYWVDKANDILVWRSRIPMEERDMVCGPNTVLCLDTSGSMWGGAFQTMINLSLKFLSGVEGINDIPEKVGVVCFGADTRVISHCCLNYPSMKREIKKLSAGGPSPLTAGLMLTLALVKSGVTIPSVSGTTFFPRVIVFTDGVATPDRVTDCEDYVPEGTDALEITLRMSNVADHFKSNGNRVYFVPLGQSNEAMLSPLVEATGGKIVQPANFDKLIYQHKAEFLAAALRVNFPKYQEADPYMVKRVAESAAASLGGIDMDDLVEYVRKPPPSREDDDDDDDGKAAHEGSSNMPPIGTRVRRGPDWDPGFTNQDGDGPGTVISHGKGGHIWVMWDNGHRNVYPYGIGNQFAVMVVDEPRILQQDEFIEVGCLVRRGDNWRDGDEDGGVGNIGVVFRVHSDATVGVRWPNRHKRRYKYGKQGFFEVEICDPFDEDVRLRMLSMAFEFQDSTEDRSNDRPRVEDFVNTEERKNNRRTLEEMNKRNNMCSNRIEDELETDSPSIARTESSESTREGTVEVNNKKQSLENSSDTSAIEPHSDVAESNNRKHSQENSSDTSAIEPRSDLVESTGDMVSRRGPVIVRVSDSDTEEKHMEFAPPLTNDSVKESEQDKTTHNTITTRSPSLLENELNYAGKPDENDETVVPVKFPEKSDFSLSSPSEMSPNPENADGCNVPSLDQASSMSRSISDITHSDDVDAHSDKDTGKDENETVTWQVHDRYEGWKDFPPEVNKRLEMAHQKNPQGMFSYVMKKKRFQVQLSKMVHIHPVTKEISRVRRNVTGV